MKNSFPSFIKSRFFADFLKVGLAEYYWGSDNTEDSYSHWGWIPIEKISLKKILVGNYLPYLRNIHLKSRITTFDISFEENIAETDKIQCIVYNTNPSCGKDYLWNIEKFLEALNRKKMYEASDFVLLNLNIFSGNKFCVDDLL